MIRRVYSSKDNKSNVVEIDVIYEMGRPVESAEQLPITKFKQSFDTLIDLVREYIKDKNFIIKVDKASPKQGSVSHYFDFYPYDGNPQDSDVLIINMRISDHPNPNPEGMKTHRRRNAINYSDANQKVYTTDPVEIRVKNRTYESIYDALNSAIKFLDNVDPGAILQQERAKHPNKFKDSKKSKKHK